MKVRIKRFGRCFPLPVSGTAAGRLCRSVCAGLEFMGVEFDPAANEVRGEDKILSTPASRVKVAVIATDEELMIATDTYNLVK